MAFLLTELYIVNQFGRFEVSNSFFWSILSLSTRDRTKPEMQNTCFLTKRYKDFSFFLPFFVPFEFYLSYWLRKKERKKEKLFSIFSTFRMLVQHRSRIFTIRFFCFLNFVWIYSTCWNFLINRLTLFNTFNTNLNDNIDLRYRKNQNQHINKNSYSTFLCLLHIQSYSWIKNLLKIIHWLFLLSFNSNLIL